MNYDFFADKEDKISVLDYIINETDLQIFDFNSEPGKLISEYTHINDITEKFELEIGGSYISSFCLYKPNFGGKIYYRKIELDKNLKLDSYFRYSMEGWGLINLHFGGLKNSVLHRSKVNHFSLKGAQNWEAIHPQKGKAEKWNWEEIIKSSKLIKYEIHNKMSVEKIGTCGVMRKAYELSKDNITLI